MNKWLTCTILDPLELSLIQALRDAATVGEDNFWAMVQWSFHQQRMIITSAIFKARSQGILKEWGTERVEVN